MKTNPIRLLAYILTALLLISALAACHRVPPAAPPTGDPATPPVPSDNTLSIGCDGLSGQFHPFFARSESDRAVTSLVTLPLLDTDRDGNVVWQSGIADGTVTENTDGTVIYDFTLREDVRFSDGEPLTADDVIFSMYVLADPSYDGPSAFSSLPIQGLADYHAGVTPVLYEKYAALADAIWAAGPDATAYNGFTEAQYQTYWGDALAAAGVMFVDEIVDYCLQHYAAFLPRCQNNAVVLAMYAWGYGTPNEDGTFTDAFGTTYDLKTAFPTKADFWQRILTAHNRDFSKDGVDRDAVTSSVADLLKKAFVALEGPKDENEAEIVHAIAGIEKTGDLSVRVTLTASTDTPQALNVPVAPLHYYGSDAAYDYQNHTFGFPKGDLSGVKAKTSAPLGAGPYVFGGYENGTVSFTANATYRNGCPAIDVLLLKEVAEGDALAALADGMVDVAAANAHDARETLDDAVFTALATDDLASAVIFNTARIDPATLPAAVTSRWSWFGEIETLKMN